MNLAWIDMFWRQAFASGRAGSIDPVSGGGQGGTSIETALAWISIALSVTALAVLAWKSLRRLPPPPDEAAERVRRILDELPEAILLLDSKGRIVWMSGSTRRLFGWTVDGSIGVSAFKFVHPDDQSRASERFADLLGRPGGQDTVAFRFLRHSGEVVPMEWTSRNLVGVPGIDGILILSRIAHGSDPVAQVDRPLPLMADPRRPRVLVAEDDRTNQVVIRKQLEGLGCEAVIAGDGAAALARMAVEVFDLVLLDCQMPILDGFETVKEIRRLEQEQAKARRPVLAVTAWAMYDDQQLCLQSGMDEVLTKPLRQDVLADALSRWLGYTKA